MIDWNQTHTAIWRRRKECLRPVEQLDTIRLDDLLGIDRQKQSLIDNTERFLAGKPANNVLLWGARGTGKSSLIKALLNEYKGHGLRVIEVDKQDLIDLPEIVDDIREQDLRFIVYCDDLTFEADNGLYTALKSVMEGSIELSPENGLLYATSNRRHLMPEQMLDNLDTRLVEGGGSLFRCGRTKNIALRPLRLVVVVCRIPKPFWKSSTVCLPVTTAIANNSIKKPWSLPSSGHRKVAEPQSSFTMPIANETAFTLVFRVPASCRMMLQD